MQRVEIDVPDELAAELTQYGGQADELLRLGLRQMMKIRETLTLYEHGSISFARAAELAGVSREELIHQARAAGVQPRWSEQMVREELA